MIVKQTSKKPACFESEIGDRVPVHDSFWPALALLLISVIAVASFRLVPRAGRPVLALFSSALSASEVFARTIGAGAEVLDWGPVKGSVIAVSDDGAVSTRLRAAGAWLVVAAAGDPGCGGLRGSKAVK